jgi:hypothetical protein
MIVMIVRHHTDAKILGAQFAELIRKQRLPIQKLWWHESDILPELWILTDPITDLPDLKPIFRSLTTLQQCFPEALFDEHLLNPGWVSPGYNVESEVPNDAVEVELWG